MTSYHRRQTQRERERRLARRRKTPKRRQRGAASGLYAVVLFVLLVLVLLVMRNYSNRLAGAFVDATTVSHPHEDAPAHSPVDSKTVNDVRHRVWNAVDRAQREAINALADDDAPSL